MQMKLVGSRPWNDVTGFEPTGGVSSYIHTGDAKNSLANIPNYARLKAAGVYSGVDLVLYSNGGDLEFDFVVAPGADPMQIQLAYEGIERIHVDDRVGNLILIRPLAAPHWDRRGQESTSKSKINGSRWQPDINCCRRAV
jgi:hypothetical protein